MKLLILFLLFLNHICLTIAAVPLVVSGSQSFQNDVSSALKSSDPSTFSEKLQFQQFVLFVQPHLSVEDLSGGTDVFKNLIAKTNKNSLFIPQVQLSGRLVEDFFRKLYNETETTINVDYSSDIFDIKNVNEKTKLIIVNLPSSVKTEDRKLSLKKSDEIIGKILNQLKDNENAAFGLTGKKSWAQDSAVKSRVVRQAPPIKDYPCVTLRLLGNVTIRTGETSTVLTQANRGDDPTPDCQKDTAKYILKYKDVPSYEKISIKLNFARTTRTWQMAQMELETMSKNTVADIFLSPKFGMDKIPINRSYICSASLIWQSNKTAVNTPLTTVTFKGMQVEPFKPDGTKIEFSPAWDCVGFFTIPIWTGLLTGILFTLILAIGLYMLSDIKTMDKFDDPKSKHAVVIGANE